MRTISLALLALLTTACLARAGEAPTVRLVGPRTATAGAAWSARLVVTPRPAAQPVVTARLGAARQSARVTREGGGFRVRAVLPSPGSWRLSARVGGRSFALGALRVRAPSYSLNQPFDLTAAPDGTFAVASFMGHRVFRVDPRSGRLTLLAGNGRPGFSGDGGPATQASLNQPRDLAFDPAGNLYVASDTRVRRVDAGTGVITTVAGTGRDASTGDGGPAREASLRGVGAIAADAQGNLFVSEVGERIRRIDARSGVIDHYAGAGEGFAGDGGPATAARFRLIHGLAVAPDGDLVVGDTFNHRVRRIDAATGRIETVAGTGAAGLGGDGGPATRALLANPSHLAFGPDGSLYVGDFENDRVRRIAPDGTISTAGPVDDPTGVAVAADGTVYACSLFSPTIARVRAGG